MEYYAGIDVSLKESSVCIVDAKGKIVREVKVASEPETLVRYFDALELPVCRIGLEAGREDHHRDLVAGLHVAALPAIAQIDDGVAELDRP
ncbi:transposase [Novosphingobium sp. Rr 2-17]|nr:transposase [Novosphingobium sp. Rr 2-17]